MTDSAAPKASHASAGKFAKRVRNLAPRLYFWNRQKNKPLPTRCSGSQVDHQNRTKGNPEFGLHHLCPAAAAR